jgi:hypothetical protein
MIGSYKTGALGRGLEFSRFGKGIPCTSYTKVQSRMATIQGSHSNLRCATRERFGHTTVSNVRKRYLLDIVSSIRLFADDCIIYRNIPNKEI